MSEECNEDYYGPQRDSIYIVVPLTVVYVVMLITGTIGNVSTCVVIARNKSMHTATNYYLFSLAISDLLLLLAGLPQEIYLFWWRYPYIFGGVFCFLRGLFAETSGNATVLTITAFTIERYLAICHPFLSHTMSKLSRVVKLILLIWVLSVGLAIPQALPLKVIGDCPQCMIVDTIIEHAFELSTFLFFVAPMTLIVVLYVLIGMRLKSSRMMKKRISTNARIQSKSSRKVVKMLVAVVVAFFICWAPFHVQRLYSIYQYPSAENHELHLKIYEVVTYISGILYYMSATINPILYNIMSAKFREAFKETFSCCCGFSHLNHGRPQRSYSVLSKSNLRGPDSTDSGSHDHTVHTNTSQKNSSMDSFSGRHGRKYKTSSSIKEDMEENVSKQIIPQMELQNLQHARTLDDPAHNPVHMENSRPPALNKFFEFFHCFAKKTLDDSRRLSSYYSSPLREMNILETGKIDNTEKEIFKRREDVHNTCISNSSLKDIETGAIEDELTAYMKEIRQREGCS